MIMAQFGNPDWGQELLAELEQDPLFVELWNRNRLADAQNDRRMNLITEKGPRTLQLQYNSILGTDQTAPIEGELVEFEGSPEQQAAADRQWRALCDRGFWQPPAQKASSFPT